jgi:hypothetical protein
MSLMSSISSISMPRRVKAAIVCGLPSPWVDWVDRGRKSRWRGTGAARSPVDADCSATGKWSICTHAPRLWCERWTIESLTSRKSFLYKFSSQKDTHRPVCLIADPDSANLPLPSPVYSVLSSSVLR